LKRLVYLTTIFFAVLTIALVLLLRSEMFTSTLLSYLVPVLEEKLNSKLVISELKLPIFTTTLEIGGVKFSPNPQDEDDPLVSFRKIKADIDLLNAMRGRLEIKDIEVDGLTFKLLIGEDGVLNLPEIDGGDEDDEPDDDGESSFKIKLGNATLRNCRFYMEERGVNFKLDVKNIDLIADLSDLIDYTEIRFFLRNASVTYAMAGMTYAASSVNAAGRFTGDAVEFHDANIIIAPQVPGGPTSRAYINGRVSNLDSGSVIVEVEADIAADARIVNKSITKFPPLSGLVYSKTKIYVDQDTVSVSGPIFVPQARIWKFDLQNLRANYEVGPNGLVIDRFDLNVCSGKLTGNYRMRFNERKTYRAQTEAHGLDLACFSEALGKKSLSLTGKIGDAVDAPVVITSQGGFTPLDLAVEIDLYAPLPVSIRIGENEYNEAGVPQRIILDFLRIKSRFTVDKNRISLEPFEFAGPRERVVAEGWIDYRRGFSLAFNARFAELSELVPFLPVLIKGGGSVGGTVAGQLDNPTIHANLNLEQFQLDHFYFSGVLGDINMENRRIWSNGLKLKNIYSEINITGGLSFGKNPQLDLGVDINDTRIEEVFVALTPEEEAWARSRGLINARVDLRGPLDKLDGRVNLTIDQAELYDEKLQTISADLQFNQGEIVVNSLALFWPDGGALTGGGKYGTNGSLDFVFESVDLETPHIINLNSRLPDLTGNLSLKTKISGKVDNPRIDAELAVDEMQLYSHDWGKLSGFFLLENKHIFASVVAADGSVYASAELRLEQNKPFHLFADLTRLDIGDVLGSLTGLSNLSSSIKGRVTIDGELDHIRDLRAELKLEELHLARGDLNLSSKGAIFAEYSQRRLNLSPFSIGGSAISLVLQEGYIESEGDIYLPFKGYVNLSALELINLPLNKVEGMLMISKGLVEGPISSPTFSGNLRLNNGVVVVKKIADPFNITMGVVTLVNGRGTIDRMDVEFAGGSITGGGFFVLEKFRPTRLSFNADFENLNLRIPRVFPSTLGGRLSLNGPPDMLKLEGTVNIERADFAESIDWQSNLLKVINRKPEVSSDIEQKTPLEFDIKIQAPGTIKIRNNLASLSLDADLHLVGPFNKPGLIGAVEMVGEKREIFFLGTTLQVDNGTIEFGNESAIEPKIDLQASTTIDATIGTVEAPVDETFKVTLTVDGKTTQNDLRINYFCEPTLPSEDILCLLAVGSTCERAGAAAAVALAPEVGQVSRDVGELLGIDRVRLEPSYSKRSGTTVPFITLTKNISDNVEVRYSTSVAGAGDQKFTLEYKLTRNFSLLGSWDDQAETAAGNLGADMKFRFRFR
jgi:autotransporter translocation and assembly factor TamB